MRSLRPETTSEDIYSACRDGDEYFAKEWAMNPEHDINQTDQHGFTPLHYASMYGHGNIVELFLVRTARTDLVNMGGDTLLHLAASYGKYDIVMKLLRSHTNVDHANEHGNTPLHYASFWNHIGICEVLVKHGATIAIANKFGDTPLTKARPKLRKKLEGLAAEHGQKLVIVQHKKSKVQRKNDYLEFKQRQPEVERSQVTTALKIGQGPYGETWMGSWSGHTVVVKKLKIKGDIHRIGHMDNFPHEYSRLRVFSHDTILPLLGVIMQPEIHTISMHMKYSSLFNVLHDLQSEIKINLEEGVRFCRDICHGMAYLHGLEPLIPRFDLNPHHVFIDEDMTAKLDLAHARFSFMDNDKIYKPFWVAPEVLTHRPEDIDRRAGDMYSFAIILWEVSTSKIPFDGLSPMCAGIKIGKENARPLIPTFVNHHLQRIIDICWNADPNKRPRFEKIKPILDKLEVS